LTVANLIIDQSCMFSYDTDDRRNRALVKVGQSGWSSPLSFEAVGQASEAIIPKDFEGEDEAHLGIGIAHGSGQVKLFDFADKVQTYHHCLCSTKICR
jgi:hypothetical protein